MQEVPALPAVTGYPRETDAVSIPSPRPIHTFWPRLRLCAEMSCWSVVLFASAQTWLVQGYKVYGACMEPNLVTGERLLGSKLAAMQGIRRGDVVVFRPPHKSKTIFIKRIVGLPGEKLEIRRNRVYINGALLDEPYLRRVWHDDRAPQRIPPGMVFVMGDNRDNSNDSRTWGLLPEKNIQAKAWFRYWPLHRAEWIR